MYYKEIEYLLVTSYWPKIYLVATNMRISIASRFIHHYSQEVFQKINNFSPKHGKGKMIKTMNGLLEKIKRD